MNAPKLTLISHHLCPFVQRAAISLKEQNEPFERRYIDLADKPDWFLALSPLGKVPILVIDDSDVLFESSVIAQYINEISGGQLLSTNRLARHRQLAWMEFASQFIGGIGHLYRAASESELEAARSDLESKLRQVEGELSDGPWFAGEQFSLVDAAFGPAFRYFDVLDGLIDLDLFAGKPKVATWRNALSRRESVINAVTEDYPERLLDFLAERDSFIGKRAANTVAAQRSAA